MADPHWYRNTTWTPEIAARFEQKLRRAREKADYLRIQATYLTRAYPEVALELVDRYLAIPNQLQQALGALHQGGSPGGTWPVGRSGRCLRSGASSGK